MCVRAGACVASKSSIVCSMATYLARGGCKNRVAPAFCPPIEHVVCILSFVKSHLDSVMKHHSLLHQSPCKASRTLTHSRAKVAREGDTRKCGRGLSSSKGGCCCPGLDRQGARVTRGYKQPARQEGCPAVHMFESCWSEFPCSCWQLEVEASF